MTATCAGLRDGDAGENPRFDPHNMSGDTSGRSVPGRYYHAAE